MTTCGLHLEDAARDVKALLLAARRDHPYLAGFEPGDERRMAGRDAELAHSPVATTNSTSPWKISSSALTMSQRSRAIAKTSGRHTQLARLLDHLIHPADHVEGLLGDVIELPIHDHLEAADGLLERHVFAGLAGEHFGHEEGLTEEALDLARARDGELVFLESSSMPRMAMMSLSSL